MIDWLTLETLEEKRSESSDFPRRSLSSLQAGVELSDGPWVGGSFSCFLVLEEKHTHTHTHSSSSTPHQQQTPAIRKLFPRWEMRMFYCSFVLNLVCPFGDVNEGILFVAQSFFIKLQSWRKVAVQSVSGAAREGAHTYTVHVEREREPAFIFNDKSSICLYFKWREKEPFKRFLHRGAVLLLVGWDEDVFLATCQTITPKRDTSLLLTTTPIVRRGESCLVELLMSTFNCNLNFPLGLH